MEVQKGQAYCPTGPAQRPNTREVRTRTQASCHPQVDHVRLISSAQSLLDLARAAPGARFPVVREVLGGHLDAVPGVGLRRPEGEGRGFDGAHLRREDGERWERSGQPALTAGGCPECRPLPAPPPPLTWRKREAPRRRKRTRYLREKTSGNGQEVGGRQSTCSRCPTVRRRTLSGGSGWTAGGRGGSARHVPSPPLADWLTRGVHGSRGASH